MSEVRLVVAPIDNRETFKDKAYAALRTVIESSDIYRTRTEIRLDERQLAQDFGISRTPVRSALNAHRKARGLPDLDAVKFLKLLKEKAALVEMDMELTKREVNFGFSGGEKKRNEILQMALLEPRLALLDETDSGLDIDALKAVASGVNALRSPERAMIVVTHYQRLLDLIVPDVVHVLIDGKIVKTGGKDLALELEDKGYDWLREQAA